jgi:hypothetical protein
MREHVPRLGEPEMQASASSMLRTLYAMKLIAPWPNRRFCRYHTLNYGTHVPHRTHGALHVRLTVMATVGTLDMSFQRMASAPTVFRL